MSFNINFGQSPEINLKSNFITNYGRYSQPFDKIDMMGNQKFNTLWPLFVGIIGVFASVGLFVKSKPASDPVTGKPLEKTDVQKLLYGLGWFMLASTIFGFGYAGYLYWFIYLPQYYRWFEKLPTDAKVAIGMISTIERIETINRK